MKIAVCCKLAPDSEDVTSNPDGTVDLFRANWGISEFDINALVAAADLEPGEIVAISAGGNELNNSRMIKTLLSHGNTDSLIRIVDSVVADMDTAQLAKLLAAAVRKSGADIAIFGEGSSDRYQRVTGAQTAAELGWASVTAADKIELDGDTFTIQRDLEDEIEIVQVQTPCVISVTSTINEPPVPSMKNVLAAGKKPVVDQTVESLGAMTDSFVDRLASTVPAMPGRQKIMLEGTPDEVAAQLVSKLNVDNVL